MKNEGKEQGPSLPELNEAMRMNTEGKRVNHKARQVIQLLQELPEYSMDEVEKLAVCAIASYTFVFGPENVPIDFKAYEGIEKQNQVMIDAFRKRGWGAIIPTTSTDFIDNLVISRGSIIITETSTPRLGHVIGIVPTWEPINNGKKGEVPEFERIFKVVDTNSDSLIYTAGTAELAELYGQALRHEGTIGAFVFYD